jgi:HEAT repeat protein
MPEILKEADRLIHGLLRAGIDAKLCWQNLTAKEGLLWKALHFAVQSANDDAGRFLEGAWETGQSEEFCKALEVCVRRAESEHNPWPDGTIDHFKQEFCLWIACGRLALAVRKNDPPDILAWAKTTLRILNPTSWFQDPKLPRGTKAQGVLDSLLRNLAHQDVDVAPIRDLTFRLLDQEREVIDRRSIAIMGVREKTGFVTTLEVERIAQGTGEFYPDPVGFGFVPTDEKFRSALRASWELAAESRIDSGSNIRWRILARDGATGDSIGLAAAVGLICLWEGRRCDPKVALTGALDGRSVGGVEGIRAKVLEAAQKRFNKLIVPGINGEEAREAVPGATILPVKNVREVVQAVSRLLTELEHLLRREIDWIASFARSRIGSRVGSWEDLKGLYVPPRVARGLRPRLRPEELELLESRRSAGDYRPLDKLEQERLELRGQEMQEQLHRQTTAWETIRSGLTRTALVGDPGFGKTMLSWLETGRRNEEALRKIEAGAVSFDDVEFALYLPASEVAGAIGKKSALAAILTLIATRHESSTQIRQQLKTSIEAGRCLICLDALDEVEEKYRGSLDRALLAFVPSGSQVRMLLTSRRAGYVRSPVHVRDEDELELLAFDEPEMAKAITAWFGRDRETAAKVWSHIRAQETVKQVLRSPLLLQLACQAAAEAKRKGADLPAWERRSDLYETFLADVQEKWKARARPTEEAADCFLPLAAELCFRMWKMDPLRQFWDSKSVTDLIQKVRKLGGYEPLTRRRDLKKDLKQAGILVPFGPDTGGTPLMFIHRTFGEYLVGCHLARMLEEDTGWEFLSHKAWDPAWEEAIVFAAGQIGEAETCRKLLRLLSDEEADDLFRHRLALAARCAGEMRPTRRNEVMPLIGGIFQTALGLLVEAVARSTCAAYCHFDRAWAGLRLARGHSECAKVIDRLLGLLEDPDVSWSAAVAIDSLRAQILQIGPEIADHLVALSKHEDRLVRGLAGAAIIRLGAAILQARPEITDRLLALLEHGDPDGRGSAAYAIGRLGAQILETRPEIADRLLALLEHENPETRRHTATAIGGLGAQILETRPEVADRLAELLEDEDPDVRSSAIEAVCSLGVQILETRPEIADRLAELLEHEDWAVRSIMADAIGSLGARILKFRPEIADRLVALLEHEHPDTRLSAAIAIANLGAEILTTQPGIASRLVAPLGHEDPEVRSSALHAIGSLGAQILEKQPEVADRLASLLEDEDLDVRWGATRAIGRLGAGILQDQPNVAGRLVMLLKARERLLRLEAAKAIGLLKGSSILGAQTAVYQSLVELLQDEFEDVRESAAGAIGNMGAQILKTRPEVADRLAALLEHRDREVRESATTAIGRICETGVRFFKQDGRVEALNTQALSQFPGGPEQED